MEKVNLPRRLLAVEFLPMPRSVVEEVIPPRVYAGVELILASPFDSFALFLNLNFELSILEELRRRERFRVSGGEMFKVRSDDAPNSRLRPIARGISASSSRSSLLFVSSVFFASSVFSVSAPVVSSSFSSSSDQVIILAPS